MSRNRLLMSLLPAALAGVLTVTACSQPAPASPTAAPAKPTTAPAAPEKPAAQAPTSAAASKPADAPKPAPAASDIAAQLDQYYQRAKAANEMKVVHYGLGPEYEPLARSFAQKFPGMSVEVVNLRGPEMIQRINAEAASNKYVATVASTGLTTMSELERLGRLVQWEPPTAKQLPTPEGGSDNYRWMISVGLFGMVVNTNMVPADRIPTKRDDLLDPFFKGRGKLLSEDPRAAGGGQSFWVITHDDMGKDFLEKIKAQEITFTRERDAAPAQIARGEFGVFFATAVNQELIELEKTAPVKVAFFRDGGAHFTDITAGVVKDTPAQDAAKLWVAWLTSPDGQRELVEKVSVYPSLSGVPAPGGWPTFDEIKPKSRTNEQRSRNDQYIGIFEDVFFK